MYRSSDLKHCRSQQTSSRIDRALYMALSCALNSNAEQGLQPLRTESKIFTVYCQEQMLTPTHFQTQVSVLWRDTVIKDMRVSLSTVLWGNFGPIHQAVPFRPVQHPSSLVTIANVVMPVLLCMQSFKQLCIHSSNTQSKCHVTRLEFHPVDIQ